MNIDTDKLVEILKKDKPLSLVEVNDDRIGKPKLYVLFCLPEIVDEVTDFSKNLLNKYD